MKKLMIALMLFPAFVNAQYFITICEDKMVDKKYAYGDHVLLCSNDGKDGFSISIVWSVVRDKWLPDSAVYIGLYSKSNVGTCYEKDKLVFLFEDDTRFDLTSWNSFNCEGKSYYDYEKEALRKLGSKLVKAIRFTNGRSGESFTYILRESEKAYFVQAYSAALMRKYKWSDCSE
jgi:hypothetical protein